MKDKVLVSVIVTAYNIKDYLPRCLDSLLRQTYENLEVIVVDDGSTDGTAAICDDYAAKNARISVIHKENGGPSSARNAGVAIAHGEYIGYVDGDDWTEPEMYEHMLAACMEHHAEIAICTYRQVGKGSEEIHPTGDVAVLSREEALEIYISGHPQYHIFHSVWSKLFKREVIQDVAFPEGRKSEDIMYTTWSMARASKCVFLDTPYYNYMVDREDSIMNTKLGERRFGDEIPFWREQAEYLAEQGLLELSYKSQYQFYRRLLFYYVDFRDLKMMHRAEELIVLLKKEKGKIAAIYENPYVAKGDKVRMKVFLLSPGIYYRIVKLYDRFVIPLRQG